MKTKAERIPWLLPPIAAALLLLPLAGQAQAEKKPKKTPPAPVTAAADASSADAAPEDFIPGPDGEEGAGEAMAALPVPPAASGDDDWDDEEDDDEEEDEGGHGSRGSREDLVLIGQGKTIEEGEVVEGDAVVVGADLTVNGTVKGDAVCVGGKLTIGPKAKIRGDAVNVGGKADVDPSARIKGSRVNVVGVPLGILEHLKHLDGIDDARDLKAREKGGAGRFSHRFIALVSELMFFVFLLFVALLMTTFMPRQLGRYDEHLVGDFPRSALLGVAVMILLPLVLLILAVTIVGIPLIPLLLLAVAVTGLMGYIAFGKVLGRKLVGDKSVMLQLLVGLALLQGASILGDLIALPGGSFALAAGVFKTIGTVIFIGGMFLGLGAVAYSRWGKRTLAQTQAARSPNGSNGHVPPAPPAAG
jgi:hypothetical protein